MADHGAIAVLLVEEDAEDAVLIQKALTSIPGDPYVVAWERCLAGALKRLAEPGIQVILLNLQLPDARGLVVFRQVFQAAPQALLLVLSASANEEMALQAVQAGACDYLTKGHLDAHWLPRILGYAIERKSTQDALRISEARFRAISDASPLGIFVTNTSGACVYTNQAYQEFLGRSRDDTLGVDWSQAIHPEDFHRVINEWHQIRYKTTPYHSEARFLRDDGKVVWARINSAPMLDGEVIYGYVQTVEDISAWKRSEQVLKVSEEALFAERERAQVTLNSIGDAVISTDLLGNVSYLNPVAQTMTGWPGDEGLGQPLSVVFKVVDGATRSDIASPARRAIDENRTVGLKSDSLLIRRDGRELAVEDSTSPIHDQDGVVTGAVIVFHDVTESRANAMKMTELAQHDFLTGLPNRILLIERLSQSIRLAQRHGKQAALMFIDLDHFKIINDSMGHAVGDLLLQSVAERLVSCVRATDTVCRQGGDEFVVVLAEIGMPRDVVHVAEKLLAAFALPHLVNGRELQITLSIGISEYPENGGDVDTLMVAADAAMYRAKAEGGNNYQYFGAGSVPEGSTSGVEAIAR